MAVNTAYPNGGRNPYNRRLQQNTICVFWLQGRCNRNPCRFLHADTATHPKNRSLRTVASGADSDAPKNTNGQLKVCDHWISETCVYGEKCGFLHSWLHSDEDNLSLLVRLSGHKKGVIGVGLPSGSNKLYSGAKDGTVRVWDCESGKCIKVINNGAEIGCLIVEGSWVFLGLPNSVKAWRVDLATGGYDTFLLDGPVGQVNAMVVFSDLLFAGSDDGVISIWRGSLELEANPFKLVAKIKAHTAAVLSLSIGIGMQEKRLFSGSADGTINVWDLESLQCFQTLNVHGDAVTSLLCCDEYLFSGSLDKTIKVWALTQLGSFELMYKHEEECGIVAMLGMVDADGKPILLCSCKDSAVRLYELPSFKERARVFSRREVLAMQRGPDGLFFLGDGSGVLSVWKWKATPTAEPEQTQ